jgi:hypothetical protein
MTKRKSYDNNKCNNNYNRVGRKRQRSTLVWSKQDSLIHSSFTTTKQNGTWLVFGVGASHIVPDREIEEEKKDKRVVDRP